MSKRGTSPPGDGQLVKRSRSNTPPRTQLVISSSGDDRQKGLIRTVKRTSNLEAPIISLSGAHSVSGVNVRALLGDSRISCQGRDSKLSIRSYGTKYCRLFSRPKRLCVLSFLVRAHADLSIITLFSLAGQPSGGLIHQIPTMASCRAFTKPPSSTFTGLSARRRSTLSLQTTPSVLRT